MGPRLTSPSRSLALLVVVLTAAIARPARAYTPQSPEVQAMVNRAIAHIQEEIGKIQPESGSMELGGYCLAGLAAYSHTGNSEHPLVKRAVEEIRRELRSGIPDNGHSNYSLGIGLIFLGSVDAAAYMAESQGLLRLVYQRQKSFGAWSYPDYPTGDTSQTQFACLGMWIADRQGITVPMEVVDRVTNWLIRTQAPDGGFGYQGKDPGGFNRVAQERTTASMGVAGAGSLYVCGELLGFFDPAQESKNASKIPGLIVKKKKKAVTSSVDVGKWRAAISDGDNWVSRNAGTENGYQGGAYQQYYYMYTIERYWAFKELTIPAAKRSKEPAWYNSGVDYLRKRVDPKTGGWKSNENHTAVDTAFAVLFLLRSSQKTIQRIVEAQGLLIGGKSLPDDPSKITQDASGRIVSNESETSLEDILKVLEDSETSSGSMWEDLARQLTRAIDEGKSAEQLDRLRRMVISGPFASRMAAVKALSRVRDLDNVPVLIYALTDPDTRVSRAAVDGLRFISRRIDGPAVNEDANAQQKEAVAKQWTDWFLGVKPDGALIE